MASIVSLISARVWSICERISVVVGEGDGVSAALACESDVDMAVTLSGS
jgi:hypothetical protein